MRAMKLVDWLKIPNPDGTRKRRRVFAARIGVTPTMITEYCKDHGGMWPRKEIMQRIFDETGGDVTANDFIETQERVA